MYNPLITLSELTDALNTYTVIQILMAAGNRMVKIKKKKKSLQVMIDFIII